jgi:hypothetical protein
MAYPNMPDLEHRDWGRRWERGQVGRHSQQTPLDFRAHYLGDDFAAPYALRDGDEETLNKIGNSASRLW